MDDVAIRLAVHSRRGVYGAGQALFMRHVWTASEEAILRRDYPVTDTGELAARLNLSRRQVFNKAHDMGLKKQVKAGSTTQFQPGNVPHNKGKPFRPGGGSAETYFKKGNVPPHTLRVNAITTNSYGRRQIKVADHKWQLLHVHVWEKHNGPVPDKHVVIVKDRTKSDCDVDNLQCISRAEMMNRNSIHRYPNKLKSAIRTLSKFRKKIRSIEHEK